MYTRNIPASSLWAWLCAAVTGPVAMMAAGCSWPISLGLGLGAGAVYLGTLSGGERKLPRPVLLLELVWTGVILVWVLGESARIWPDSNAHPTVPLVLLALSVWASSDSTRGPRIGSVCLYLLALLFGVVILCAQGDVRPGWTLPQAGGTWEPLVLSLLLPAGAFLLPREGAGKKPWALLPGVLAAAVSLCAGGVLAPWVAWELPDPLWELGRSIRLMGSSVHLEAVLCAGLVLSWFCLSSYLVTMGASVFQKLLPERSSWGRWVGGGTCAGALLCEVSVAVSFLLLGTTIFWVFIPILTQAVDKIKKMQNFKKSA